MKKIGTLNTHLSRMIASMGHGDQLVISDSGLPIPRDKECVDLAVTENIPRFIEVLKVVLEELQVESAVVANEMKTANPSVYSDTQKLLVDVRIEAVTHEDFKHHAEDGKNTAFVRTGEATPFANIILRAGVTF